VRRVDDETFLDAFERCALQGHGFNHRDHLRMAWLYVRRYGLAEAAWRADIGLRRLANAHGHPDRYSVTRTTAWVSLVAHHVAEAPDLEFGAFLDRFPPLLDGRLLDRHYSTALLASAASRAASVAPDLRPLPAG
jgi:hypothetical protein